MDVFENSKTLPPAPPYDSHVGWVPQIRSVTLPSGVTVPPVAVTAPERSPDLQSDHPPTPNSGPALSPVPSPPPVYRVLGVHPVPVTPTPPASDVIDVPPTPLRLNLSSPSTVAPTPVRETFDLPPVPSPGPSPAPTTTTFSQASARSASPRMGLATIFSQKSLPILMLVTSPFKPTRNDELSVRTGDTVRLIKEYEDEWCLVQRVGRPDAEKGVVPRFCLTERPSIIKHRTTFTTFPFKGVRRKR
ncbi:hypothetical protein F5148DRAFT_905578 [Russula earlei]|uniref:Uncharacterized protein n=1 Tax=Russula earlei TaxID=71964 RepID=A0ACC0U9Q0_9AGAM|nr:hypothetical protein F5148DRAFT_905578 [Russula earlei]